ncbi:MAG: hypothetical protein RIC12_00800 [Pirellulales bacterium]
MVVVGFYASGKLEKVEPNKAVRVVEVTESVLRPRDGVSVVDIKKIKPTRISTSIKKLPSVPVGGVTILRGPPPEEPFLRIVPIAESALIDDSPEFSWPQQEGATAYEVSLLDVL